MINQIQNKISNRLYNIIVITELCLLFIVYIKNQYGLSVLTGIQMVLLLDFIKKRHGALERLFKFNIFTHTIIFILLAVISMISQISLIEDFNIFILGLQIMSILIMAYTINKNWINFPNKKLFSTESYFLKTLATIIIANTLGFGLYIFNKTQSTPKEFIQSIQGKQFNFNSGLRYGLLELMKLYTHDDMYGLISKDDQTLIYDILKYDFKVIFETDETSYIESIHPNPFKNDILRISKNELLINPDIYIPQYNIYVENNNVMLKIFKDDISPFLRTISVVCDGVFFLPIYGDGTINLSKKMKDFYPDHEFIIQINEIKIISFNTIELHENFFK